MSELVTNVWIRNHKTLVINQLFHIYQKENIAAEIVAKVANVTRLKALSHKIMAKEVVPKRIHNPPTKEISAVQIGRGESGLKNVLNLYGMSGEGEGVVKFLCGKVWIFSRTTHSNLLQVIINLIIMLARFF